MSHSRLPPEISNYIVDLLHGEFETLNICCLVSKSWVPRARKQLFRRVAFRSFDDLNAWKENFPDPVNSPARYTCSLFIGCKQVIAAAVVEESGWIRVFSNVVSLVMFVPEILAPRFFKLLCSLPLLKDLDMLSPGISNNGDDGTIFQPSTSPPLTGTLKLYLTQGMGSVVPRLLELPNGVRFRKLQCKLCLVDDLRWTKAIVEECSDTLECVEVSCAGLLDPGTGLIDFSKAIRLKEVVFRLGDVDDVWAAMALKTLTSKHPNLQKAIIGISLGPYPVSARARHQWMDLDRVLVQLWESNAVCTRVVHNTKEDGHEFIGGLLPDATTRGIIEMAYLSLGHRLRPTSAYPQ